MHWIILIILVGGLIAGPQLWAKYTFRRYAKDNPALPGTGGELAKHLIERFKLNVKLEQTETGDHYDPQSQTVRLTPDNFNGRSLTAVAVAVHEVGHAIQHAQNSPLLNSRTKLVKTAQTAQRLGSIALLAIPIMVVVTRAPSGGLLMVVIGVTSLLISTLVHLVTLPVEWDASFGKAMPIIEEGQYVSQQDLPAVRKILRAAALTYLAGSLISIINLFRWLRLARGR